MTEYHDLTEEEDNKMDKEKAKVAIAELRKAMKAVKECKTDVECWIVKDLCMHIEELQNEIGGNEYEKNLGNRQAST